MRTGTEPPIKYALLARFQIVTFENGEMSELHLPLGSLRSSCAIFHILVTLPEQQQVHPAAAVAAEEPGGVSLVTAAGEYRESLFRLVIK